MPRGRTGAVCFMCLCFLAMSAGGRRLGLQLLLSIHWVAAAAAVVGCNLMSRFKEQRLYQGPLQLVCRCCSNTVCGVVVDTGEAVNLLHVSSCGEC